MADVWVAFVRLVTDAALGGCAKVMLNDLPPPDDYADLEIVTDLRHCLSGIVGMHTMPIIGALDSAAIRTDPACERHAHCHARGYPIIRRAHQVACR